ncbi:hypothetical protein BS78_K283700 [Paspalum vaginatum]|uniref:Uncharacterized protein n=1 Tax=Paspalum vaginatum TaxID=158149 RepID=A0A9W7X879_9POAL|nr:hypothetical protein BS78_K283700 [Paspalum vaginatum]
MHVCKFIPTPRSDRKKQHIFYFLLMASSSSFTASGSSLLHTAFLASKVTRAASGFFLSQQKYICQRVSVQTCIHPPQLLILRNVLQAKLLLMTDSAPACDSSEYPSDLAAGLQYTQQ